jgi:hypothetical protein
MNASPIYVGRSEVKFPDGSTGIKAVLVDADGAPRTSSETLAPIAIDAPGTAVLVEAPGEGQRIRLAAMMCKPSADCTIRLEAADADGSGIVPLTGDMPTGALGGFAPYLAGGIPCPGGKRLQLVLSAGTLGGFLLYSIDGI